jgi:hypothetical protein
MMSSASVQAFAGKAREYCAFIEVAAGTPLPDRLATARRLLVEVYLLALALPEGPPSDESEDDIEVRAPLDWPDMGDAEFYRLFFDPYEEDQEAVTASLSDDLLDIYRDLRSGLAILDSGRQHAEVDAAWEWRFGFEGHWGNHAVAALRALHWAISRASDSGLVRKARTRSRGPDPPRSHRHRGVRVA